MINEPEQRPAGPAMLRVPPGAIRSLRWAVAAVAIFLILDFAVAAAMRLHYPYDLNDTGMLISVLHVRQGLPLYVPPAVAFTPFLYTPLYFYAAAGMARLTGPNYEALRLVSTLSTFGCFAAIYALVYAEVRRHLSALVAVGAFAACYPVVLQWFDVGRVDMLYLCFVAWAFFFTRRGSPVVAGVLWACAFQTKQGVLPVAVLALCHDWQRPRRLVTGLGTYLVLTVGSVLLLTHATGGWYRMYVFELAGGLGYDLHLMTRFFTGDLLSVYGVALLIVLAAVLFAAPRWRGQATSFYALGAVGMILFTGYLRSHRGAGQNALLPAYLWIAVLLGVSMDRLLRSLEERVEADQHAGRDARSRGLSVLLLAGVFVQLAMHVYSPREGRPRPETVAERDAFEAQIRSIPGDVLVAAHPEDAVFAGKPIEAQVDATGAVIDANPHGQGDRLIADYAALIHERRFAAIVLDQPVEAYSWPKRRWLLRDLSAYYPLTVVASGAEQTDFGPQPQIIFLPCRLQDVARRLNPRVDVSACR